MSGYNLIIYSFDIGLPSKESVSIQKQIGASWFKKTE
jgi:hypothetical protein